MTAKSFMVGVLLIPALVFSEPVKVDKPVICDNVEIVVKYITGEFGEQPIWMGSSPKGEQSALFVNTQTGTWSIISTTQTKACLLESGVGFQLRTLPQKGAQSI